MTSTPEPTEYELRLEALKLSVMSDDTTHGIIQRAKEFASYLRDGIDTDRAAQQARQRAKSIVERRCDECLSGMHPHVAVRCPNDRCLCTEVMAL